MQLRVPTKYTILRLCRDVPCKLVAQSGLHGIMIANHNECDVEVCTPKDEHCIIKPDTIKKFLGDEYTYGIYIFNITDTTPQASLTIIGIDRLEEMYRI
jgi:hypothetical protein